MAPTSAFLLLSSALAFTSAAFSSTNLEERADIGEHTCWGDDWLFTSDMSDAIDGACAQMGPVSVPKGDWRGATIGGLRREGDPADVPTELFLSFTNKALDGGWYIDPTFCSSAAKDLMNACKGKHSDSSGGIWHREEGDITLDASRDLTPENPTYGISNGKCFDSDCGVSTFVWEFNLLDHATGKTTHCDHTGSVLNCK